MERTLPALKSMDTYFQGHWRMDWGLGNPNKTASVIAGLMVAAWILALLKRTGFWAALALCTGLGMTLILTFSRGGMVAAIAGLLPVVISAERPWRLNRVIASLFCLTILLSYALYLDADVRYVGGFAQEDKSITNRLRLWQVAPRMMVDAPEGWGLGNSGNAYMQWYQPLDRHEGYRTMVSSHLTWLVEFGWLSRLGYLASWSALIWLCWPAGVYRQLYSVGLGCILELGVSCFFSSVGESIWIWMVPSGVIILLLVRRCSIAEWPKLKFLFFGSSVAALATLGLLVAGILSQKSFVKFVKGDVILGEGTIRLWIVPNENVFGKYFGSGLRESFRGDMTKESICVSPSFPGKQFDGPENLLVVAALSEKQIGKALTDSLKFRYSILLINPLTHPYLLNVGLFEKRKVEAWLSRNSNSPANHSWRKINNVPLTEFDDISDYSDEWFKRIREKIKKKLE